VKLSRLGTIGKTVSLGESLGCLTAHEVNYIVGDDVAAEKARNGATDAAGSTTRERARTLRDRS
jgi:hypothetical protein